MCVCVCGGGGHFPPPPQRSLDVCVFTISADELANELLAAHRRGVAVRIITDDSCELNGGSDIARLRAGGIPARNDGNVGAFMHNKVPHGPWPLTPVCRVGTSRARHAPQFAIVDGELVVNGSFNWTVSAVTKNNENVGECPCGRRWRAQAVGLT